MHLRFILLGLLLTFASTPAAAAPLAPVSEGFSVAVVEQITSEKDGSLEGMERRVQHLVLLLLSGPKAGQTFQVQNGVLGDRPDMDLKQGDRVAVELVQNDDGSVDVLLRERYRLPGLLWLTLAFVALAVVLGGWTGMRSIAGLAVSVLVLIFFVIPRIIGGADPLLISLIGSALIASVSLYVAHGIKRRTSVALLATVVTLLCSMVIAAIAVRVAALFGMGSEESMFLQMGQLHRVDLRGLLLGGMLLGTLGVLDDITTAQCAVVDEVSKANPSLSARELRSAGASVGREHIASLINTLALAYAGASLPLLLLLDMNGDYPLWVMLNGEFLAEEIVRTLVGSTALLFAVPISTRLASVFLRAAPGARPVHSAGHTHGHSHG